MLPGAPGDRPGSNRIPHRTRRNTDADRHQPGEHQHHRDRPGRMPLLPAPTGVQPITGTSPVVQAWSCTACGTNWAITCTPRPAYLVDLGAAVEEIRRLRWVGVS